MFKRETGFDELTEFVRTPLSKAVQFVLIGEMFQNVISFSSKSVVINFSRNTWEGTFTPKNGSWLVLATSICSFISLQS